MKTVAIHQPNFFPWLGYFDKIRCADVFIFLDDAQYQKTGGTWSNRVKILINGEGRWLTAPVDRHFQGTRNVNEMIFVSKEDWRGKMLISLVSTYKRAPHFIEAYPVIESLIQNSENNVAEYNIHAIKVLASKLGYSMNSMVRSSELSTESSATERLIMLTKRLGGKNYLCGGGAGDYQEDGAFDKAGISLVYQNFSHPTYPQFRSKAFVAGLSILDAIMNLGFKGVEQLLQNNEK
jgi:hypothetical protein